MEPLRVNRPSPQMVGVILYGTWMFFKRLLHFFEKEIVLEVKVLQFEEALASTEGKRHLLLGNGFSCAVRPDIFRYAALREAARFDEISGRVFDALETMDFEKVARALEESAKIAPCFGVLPQRSRKMHEYAELVKRKLIETLAATHPERPSDITDAQYKSCQEFLNHFLSQGKDGKIYTLNYDLLLYWTLMHGLEEGRGQPLDGFCSAEDEPDAPYVVWNESQHNPNVYYLHGALHLLDAGPELRKITWRRTDVPLIDQVNAALDRDVYPLFVAEGTSEQKMERINHSMYLGKGYRSLTTLGHSLFLYGISLDNNDKHILDAIQKSNVKRLYVGLFGDPDAPNNQMIVNKASLLVQQRSCRRAKAQLDVAYYDSASAHVWDKYVEYPVKALKQKVPLTKKAVVNYG